ncbi:hypothetical protein Tco_0726149 [Tanacetum coccineum]|uniref:Uncharacterized protein n=1 Tax=Tanacetum coccineum TaxID=301880 RepID=A0ABQ4YGD1_9ASTR
MTSLKKKYERQRLIPGEIGITSSLHAPKRFPSLSGRKRKAQELEPKFVNISKRRAFWSLNEDILKINDSDNQYAVSIKEDTTYTCLHSPKTTKERSPIRRIQRSSIRRIQDIVSQYGVFQLMDMAYRSPDLEKEISTNIGGEFTNMKDLEVLESWKRQGGASTNSCYKLNMEDLPSKYQGSFSF